MDVLERYMNAVRTYLPHNLSQAQQDDIINELSENIQEQMDDHAAELGRPLDSDEQEAILHQHGHPMNVAGRYQTNQGRVAFGRELIGTILYPIYLKVLGVVMVISLAIYALVVIAIGVSGSSLTFGGVMNAIVLQVFWQFVIITGIFIVADRYLPTMPWSARDLPAMPPRARNVPRVPRLESIAEIVGIVVMVGWLWFAFDRPSLLFGPVLDDYRLAPVWQQAVAPTLLVLAVSVAQAVVNLFRPDWVRLRRVVRLVTDFAGLGILIYLLQADSWVVLANGNAAPGSVNDFVYFGLLSSSVGFAIVILMDAWKLLRGEKRQERQPGQQAQPA
jgi:uncharacterized membrane protein